MSVGVILVAAGRGERFGGDVPKQLLDLGGRSVLQRSVAIFDASPRVDTMVVVLPEALVSSAEVLIGPTRLPYLAVAGGAQRQDSVRCGLAAVPADCDLILVHDAARPFASADLVERVIAASQRTGAAVPAVAARDTVKRIAGDRTYVRETIPRDEIWLAQTPQGFRRDVLEAAMAGARSDTPATDEATLAERAGFQVEIVEGEAGNVKITAPEDLAAARVAVGGTLRVGTGYDLHRLVDGRPLVLAGVALPFDRGPHGHSDGDVVCHALADAMFGAAGAGDIGQHFPNTDPRWENAPGLDLLGRALGVVAAQGWKVSSADVTVILERPKLAPHVPAIRDRLAAVLAVEPARVSVKAKTNEGVDAVGRGEAIAAHAIVVLVAESAP